MKVKNQFCALTTKIFICFLLCIKSPLIFAAIDTKFLVKEPYVGVESIFTNQNYKQGYGKDLYPSNAMNYNVFAGVKIHRNFGVELGFEFQPKKNNRVVLTAGNYLPGNHLIMSGESCTMESSLSAKSPYLGLFAEHKLNSSKRPFKLQLMLGVSQARIKARQALLADQDGSLTQAEYAGTVKTFSKTKLVPTVRLSASKAISDRITIRASVSYKKLSGVKIHSKQEHATSIATSIRMRNTAGIGVGLIATF